MSDDIRPTDEGVEGGLYVDERGFFINGAGEYVDADGKPSDKPVKAPTPKASEQRAEEKAVAERLEQARQQQAADRAEAERRAKQGK
jgi:hypothetical protein